LAIAGSTGTEVLGRGGDAQDSMMLPVSDRKNLVAAGGSGTEMMTHPDETCTAVLVEQGLKQLQPVVTGAKSDKQTSEAGDLKCVQPAVSDNGSGMKTIFGGDINRTTRAVFGGNSMQPAMEPGENNPQPAVMNLFIERDTRMTMSINPVHARKPSKAARKERRDRALGLPVEPPAPVTIKVRCEGHLHRVVFDGQHLHLPDHPNLRRYETLFEFGHRYPCLKVLEAWRKRLRKVLPRPLLGAFDRWREQRFQARQAALLARQAAADDENYERGDRLVYHPRTVQAVRTALEQCHCHSRSRALTPPVSVHLGLGPGATGTTYGPIIQVGYNWYRTVFQAGLAVIDGRFILAVLTEEELRHRRLRQALGRSVPARWWLPALGETPNLAKGPYVLAVYQGRGCTLRLRPARVVSISNPDGTTRRVLRRCAVRKP
jgi:hypothetical protein